MFKVTSKDEYSGQVTTQVMDLREVLSHLKGLVTFGVLCEMSKVRTREHLTVYEIERIYDE